MIKKIITFILIFSFCLGQLGRLTFFRPDLVVQINDVLIFGLVSLFFLYRMLKKQKILWPEYLRPLIIFCTLGFISSLLNLKNYGVINSLIGSLYLWRLLIYGLSGVVVLNLKEFKKENVLKLLVLAGTITAVIGLVQYFVFPDLRPQIINNWDPHLFRVVGSFFDPVYIGAILVLNLILLVNLQLVIPAKAGIDRNLYRFRVKSFDSAQDTELAEVPGMTIIMLLITYMAMLLTYSRITYVMYLVSMAVIAIFKKSLKFYLLILIVFVFSLAIIPKAKSYGTTLNRQETVWARIQNYKNAVNLWQKNWLIGVGFNNYRYAQIKEGLTSEKQGIASHAASGVDSSLLLVLVTTGIIGLLTFGLLLKNIIFSLKESDTKLKIILWSSLTGIFIHSFFSNSLFYPFILEWLFVLIGLTSRFKVNK